MYLKQKNETCIKGDTKESRLLFNLPLIFEPLEFTYPKYFLQSQKLNTSLFWGGIIMIPGAEATRKNAMYCDELAALVRGCLDGGCSAKALALPGFSSCSWRDKKNQNKTRKRRQTGVSVALCCWWPLSPAHGDRPSPALPHRVLHWRKWPLCLLLLGCCSLKCLQTLELFKSTIVFSWGWGLLLEEINTLFNLESILNSVFSSLHFTPQWKQPCHYK